MADTTTIPIALQDDVTAQAMSVAEALKRVKAAFQETGSVNLQRQVSQLVQVKAELDEIGHLEAKIATFDAGRARQAAQLQAQHKRMKEDALGITAANEQEARVKAQKEEEAARAKVEALAEQQAEKERKEEMRGEAANIAAGLALYNAGVKLFEAAKELAISAAQLVKSAEELAIAQTTKREVQGGVLARLGGNYDATVKLAARYGLDEDKAIADTKRLLNAKFSSTEIPVLLKLAASMDLVQEGSGQELLAKLQEIKLKPKVDEKEIKSLASLGIDTKAVYDELGKTLHTNFAGAMARVKSGLLDSKVVIEAIEKVADKSFGGMAEEAANSIPVLFMRLKSDVAHLFDDMGPALGPIKEFLRNVASVLEGPSGQELKGALLELMSAINHALFDEFKGEEGKAKLQRFVQTAAAVIRELASDVKAAAPYIAKAINLLDQLFGKRDYSQVSEGAKALHGIVDVLLGLASFDLGQITKGLFELTDAIFGTDLAGDAGARAADLGVSIVNGIVDGITGGASAAVNAIVSMIENVIGAAHTAADAHSPSRKMARLGSFMGQGVTMGMAGENDNAAQGASDLVNSAIDGASGQAGGAPSASGAQSKRGGDTYNVSIVMPPGADKQKGREFADGFIERMRDFSAEQAADSTGKAA